MIIVLAAALLLGQDYNDPENFCANPRNGGDATACLEMLLAAESTRMNLYLEAAVSELARRDKLGGETFAVRLTESQVAWQVYADAACGSVASATDFHDVGCRSELTQERTHHLWTYYVDEDGRPLLEEPEPLQVGAPGDAED